MASTGLRVRQHERRRIHLEAEFVVGEPHRSQLRLASVSTAPEPFVVPCVLEDVSSGGAGIVVQEFLPRLVAGRLRVFAPNAEIVTADDSVIREVIFRQEVRVRRVVMRSHAPEYALGLAFEDGGEDMPDRVRELLEIAPEAGEADCA